MSAQEYPSPYGEYVLLERLGVGGMSQIDLARKAVAEADFVRFVVIKRIKADRIDDDSFVRMFKDEARITAELHHANIAHVYDFGRQGDEYYMVLEYVPGLDLRRIINVLRDRHQRVPLRIALKFLADVLAGLEYAHDKVDTYGRNMNIVHRDVNPRNVMISFRGETKLIDFGVAKATNRLEKTQTDHIKGKFAYMAPEQVQGSDVDHRADLFAVGLTLHELITGYSMFYGLSQVQIMHRLLAGRMPDLPPPPELEHPGFLMMVHAKALAMDPIDRYQTAREFRRDLEKIADPIGGLASAHEVVAFLAKIDPDLESRLQDKVHSYSGPLQASEVRQRRTVAGFEIEEPGPVDASMSGTRTVTLDARSVVAGGMALGLGAAVVSVVAVLAVGVVVLWQLGVFAGQPDLPEPRPVPVATVEPLEPTPPPEVEVDDAAPPDEIEAGTASAPVAATASPVTTAPPTVESAPATAPAEPPKPIVVKVTRTEPTPAPAPAGTTEAVVPPPEPAPKPATTTGTSDAGAATSSALTTTAPAPTTANPPDPTPPPVLPMGEIQVNSGTRGLRIYVDEQDTGQVTPSTVTWPVGTRKVRVEGYPAQTVVVAEGQRRMLLFK